MPFSPSVEANPFVGAMLGGMCIVTPVFRDVLLQLCISVGTFDLLVGLVEARQVELGVFVYQEGYASRGKDAYNVGSKAGNYGVRSWRTNGSSGVHTPCRTP